MNRSRMFSHHSSQLEKILKSKSVQTSLGIEGVIWGASELPYWKKNPDLYCEIDILFYTGLTYVKPYFVLEYKNNRSITQTFWKQFIDKEYHLETPKQLKRAEVFVKEMFNSDCYSLLVWGDLEYHYFGDKPTKKGNIIT